MSNNEDDVFAIAQRALDEEVVNDDEVVGNEEYAAADAIQELEQAHLVIGELEEKIGALATENETNKALLTVREALLESLSQEIEAERERNRQLAAKLEAATRVPMTPRTAAVVKESGFFGSIFSSFGDNFTTFSVLKVTTQAKLVGTSPLSLAKIGRIIKALQSSEYTFSDNEVDTIISALYVSRDDAEVMRAAFDIFDEKLSESQTRKGKLSANVFKQVLPLVGEDIEPEKVEQLFNEVDSNGSGSIEFDEFKTLMLKMNPE
eukprot:c5208_g1_i1.p1 GENE.c5208_g1_i1~~c5208_g1_i1.p1  ORF type:complete len:275 (-),score=78.90 c5208_g1_i1:91-882(-)